MGTKVTCLDTDGLVQERRNSSALAMELRLSCINPSILYDCIHVIVIYLKLRYRYMIRGSDAFCDL